MEVELLIDCVPKLVPCKLLQFQLEIELDNYEETSCEEKKYTVEDCQLSILSCRLAKNRNREHVHMFFISFFCLKIDRFRFS